MFKMLQNSFHILKEIGVVNMSYYTKSVIALDDYKA